MSIGSYIALLVMAGGPVPAAARVASWSDPTGERGRVHRLLIASLVWVNLQVAMVMSLLALGILDRGSLLVAELAFATLGIWLLVRAPRPVFDPSRAAGSLA